MIDAGGNEVNELEVDGIVLLAAAKVQCAECGTEVQMRYELAGDPDPEQLPEAEGVCPTCTEKNGVQTVITCAFPCGDQLAQVEEALEQANEDAGVDLAELAAHVENVTDDPGYEAREPNAEEPTE